MRSPESIKYIRITDFNDDGIPLGHEFVSAETIEERYRLEDGDLLFARSGATAGKTLIYTADIGPAIFAGYCIRFRFNPELVLPWFVYFYTKMPHYEAWVKSIQRPSGQPNINKEEFKSFGIVLPAIDVQHSLVTEMQAARNARQQKHARAEAILEGLDSYLLDQLKLTPALGEKKTVFAVQLSALRGNRIDAPAYVPYGSASGPVPTLVKTLREIADIGANRVAKPNNVDEQVPYVGLPECGQTFVREVVLRPYHEVKGRSIVREGDILFARIEPSVFNKKYVLVNDLKGYDYAYTSTEFYVVRARGGRVDQEYLYALLFSSFVFDQVRGKTTGSSGRRRIDPTLFADLHIPYPEDQGLRSEIGAEVSTRRRLAQELQQQADADWESAKKRFEQRLLSDEVPL